MNEWIRVVFGVLPNRWDVNERVEDAFEFRSGDHKVTAPLGWFVEAFAAAGSPPTATSLKGCDPTDSLGWHRHFDAWVEQGIVAL